VMKTLSQTLSYAIKVAENKEQVQDIIKLKRELATLQTKYEELVDDYQELKAQLHHSVHISYNDISDEDIENILRQME
jgi:hypothetical protein